MSKVKSNNTKPEELVCKYLFQQGFRYRKNVKTLPGKPDLVLKKYGVVIFVHGCFWHMHANCKKFTWPKTNEEFWKEKLLNNHLRDIKNQKKLECDGWRVIIIWECELRKSIFQDRLGEICQEIKSKE